MKKNLTVLLSTGLCLLSLASCTSKVPLTALTPSPSPSPLPTVSASPSPSILDESTLIGIVTAIDGNTITISLSLKSDTGAPASPSAPPAVQSPAPAAKPSQAPAPSSTPSVPPSPSPAPSPMPPDATSSATVKSAAMTTTGLQTTLTVSTQSTLQTSAYVTLQTPLRTPGSRAGTLLSSESAGAEISITLSDETVIQLDNRGALVPGKISDISIGDTIIVFMSGDTVTTVTIASFGIPALSENTNDAATPPVGQNSGSTSDATSSASVPSPGSGNTPDATSGATSPSTQHDGDSSSTGYYEHEDDDEEWDD